MAVLSDVVQEQLRERFKERLSGPVSLQLFTRPGSGRLILPAGIGCATCDDAAQLAQELADAAPDLIQLQVIDVSAESDAEVEEVPTLAISPPGQDARIRFMGLPAGFEFATVVDAIERVSREEPGLGAASVDMLSRLEQTAEVMVFVTPT
jgi:alkyl hydroperoxide reductase subunit AhpF